MVTQKKMLINEHNKELDLINRALNEKWFKGSTSLVFANCIFCIDAKIKAKDANIEHLPNFIKSIFCDYCLCPKEICAIHATKGIMNEIRLKYANKVNSLCVNDLEIKDLMKMINAFKNALKLLDDNEFHETYNELTVD